MTKSESRELDVHLAEYNSLRDEIIQNSKFQNQLINYSVLVVGGLLTSFAFLQENPNPIRSLILLAGSLLLSSIGIALLHADLQIQYLGRHVKNEISPAIRGLVNKNKTLQKRILKWEGESQKIYVGFSFMKILSLGKYFVSFLPSLILLAIFYFDRQASGAKWKLIEEILFAFSLIPFIFIGIGYTRYQSIRRD